MKPQPVTTAFWQSVSQTQFVGERSNHQEREKRTIVTDILGESLTQPSPIQWEHLLEQLNDPQTMAGAAAAIWANCHDTNPLTNRLAYSLRYLRDSIQGTGTTRLTNQEAWKAFFALRRTRPEQQRLFQNWALYAWCHSDRELTQLACQLCALYSYYGGFTRQAQISTYNMGLKLFFMGGREALATVLEAIRVVQGRAAAHELDVIWDSLFQESFSWQDGEGPALD